MDAFADRMVARGPTLAADRETWTGSLHIVDLEDAQAAGALVEHEPYNRAGLYDHHVVCGFANRLGRTMWEADTVAGDPLFLVIAHEGVEPVAPASWPLIVHGALLALEGDAHVGVALAFQAPTRAAAAAALGGRVELHDWEFGGRR